MGPLELASIGALFTKRSALVINIQELRESEHCRWILIKCGDTLFQKLGLQEVVVGSPFEILAASQLEYGIVIPGCAAVYFVAVVANPVVAAGVLPADLFSPIRGSIIRDDEFEVA